MWFPVHLLTIHMCAEAPSRQQQQGSQNILGLLGKVEGVCGQSTGLDVMP